MTDKKYDSIAAMLSDVSDDLHQTALRCEAKQDVYENNSPKYRSPVFVRLRMHRSNGAGKSNLIDFFRLMNYA